MQVRNRSNTTAFVYVNEGDTYTEKDGKSYSYVTIIDAGLSKVNNLDAACCNTAPTNAP